jgi:hypothetical protein
MDFQTIFPEVEIMKKSALDISYSADKGYERLRNKEISIMIPEGFNNDTLVKSADEAPEIGFSEIQNLEALGMEGEEVDEEIQNLGLPVLWSRQDQTIHMEAMRKWR